MRLRCWSYVFVLLVVYRLHVASFYVNVRVRTLRCLVYFFYFKDLFPAVAHIITLHNMYTARRVVSQFVCTICFGSILTHVYLSRNNKLFNGNFKIYIQTVSSKDMIFWNFEKTIWNKTNNTENLFKSRWSEIMGKNIIFFKIYRDVLGWKSEKKKKIINNT